MNSAQQTDGQLVAALTSAEADQAFAELVRRHAGMVFRTCRRVTGTHEDAEDASQAVFATVIVKARQLSGYTSLAGWMYSASWHISKRYRRADVARRQRERRAMPVMPLDEGEERDEELAQELYRALEMLPAEYREAVVLHHLQGCTIQQVADVMETSVGTTAARLSRARAMMRERLTWRGVIMTDAAIAGLFVEEVVRDGVADAAATRAAISGAAWAKTAASAAAAVACVAAPQVTAATTTAASATAVAAHRGIALYAGLRATQWIAVACVSTVLAGGAAIMANARSSITKHSRQSESASMSRTSRDAGEDDLIPIGSAAHTTGGSNVPEPTSLGLMAVAALPLLRRARNRRRDR